MTEWFSGVAGRDSTSLVSKAQDPDERELAYLMNDIGPLLYVFGRQIDLDPAPFALARK